MANYYNDKKSLRKTWIIYAEKNSMTRSFLEEEIQSESFWENTARTRAFR